MTGDQDSILKLFKKIDLAIVKAIGQQNVIIEELLNDITPSLDSNGVTRKVSIGKLKKSKILILITYIKFKGTARDGVDILTMKTEKKPDETESSLELILNTLCRAF